MKIALIGSPGSGKSTLAVTLHTITGIPRYHLDQYFWKPGWQRPDREEFKKIIMAFRAFLVLNEKNQR